MLLPRRVRAFVASLCIIGGCVAPVPLFAQAGNIHIAVLEGDYEAVKRFLEEGVPPDSYNSTGFAPLHSAARTDRADIISLLLAYDGDVNIQSRTRIDPEQAGLHIAARNGYTGLVQLLLSHGADPNIQDSRGNTPLHDAAISGDVAITRALVRGGANVAVRNAAGDDVLAVADEKLGDAVFNRTKISFPIMITPQLDFDDLSPSVSDGVVDGLLRTGIEVGISVLTPLDGIIGYIGFEMALAIPIVPFLTQILIVRLPLRVVVSFPLNHIVSLDTLLGVELDVWSGSQVQFTGFTFDIGARIDIGGVLIGMQYTLPFSIFSENSQPNNTGGTRARAYTAEYWQNKITLSLGYRIKL